MDQTPCNLPQKISETKNQRDHETTLPNVYNSKTEQNYKDVYNDFISKAPKKFITYFNRTWHDKEFYKHWTCMNRDSDFGNWVTNNCTEGYISKDPTNDRKAQSKAKCFLERHYKSFAC